MRTLFGFLLLAVPLTAQAETGWRCTAAGSWDLCKTASGVENCVENRVSSLGMHPERASAEARATDVCGGEVQGGVLSGNMAGGSLQNYQSARYNKPCAVTSCEEGQIAGWDNQAQVVEGKAAGAGKVYTPTMPVAVPPPGNVPPANPSTAQNIPECAPLIAFFCDTCGADSSICGRVKNDITSAAECRDGWGQIGGMVGTLPKAGLAGAVCSM